MLLSVKYGFVFIANTKAASTAIEHYLQRFCEVALRDSHQGKHWPAFKVEKIFGKLVTATGGSWSEMFRFGVVREPVEWTVSWYNYRCREKLACGRGRSCRGVAFEKFVGELIKGEGAEVFASLSPQHSKFQYANGDYAVDYLIPYERLSEELNGIATKLALPVTSGIDTVWKNTSPKVLGEGDVSADLKEAIVERFARDKEMHRAALDGAFGVYEDG